MGASLDMESIGHERSRLIDRLRAAYAARIETRIQACHFTGIE